MVLLLLLLLYYYYYYFIIIIIIIIFLLLFLLLLFIYCLVVMSSLKELSVKTTILSDPSKLPEQLSQYGAAPVPPAGVQSEAKR